MSDFLANLAATTLQVAPIAQPRTPALFEPHAPQGDAPLIETSEVYRVDAPPIPQSNETRRSDHENITRSNTVLRSKTNVLDSSSTSEVTTLRSELQPATIALPVERAVIPIARSEPVGREKQSGREEAVRPAVAETTGSIVEETATLISTPPPALRPRSPEIVHPKIERQATEAPATREAVESHVHISIGRIEVRAATAPVSARAAKREAAILTLDDYLRQRR